MLGLGRSQRDCMSYYFRVRWRSATALMLYMMQSMQKTHVFLLTLVVGVVSMLPKAAQREDVGSKK